jgi:hypothetical protein
MCSITFAVPLRCTAFFLLQLHVHATMPSRPLCTPCAAAGLLGDDCAVSMEAVGPADPQVFTFSAPPGGGFSVVLGLSVTGGTASM